MINELKLYDLQGIIPLPKEPLDHYNRRAQRTQLLMKEFYHLIRSSVRSRNYDDLPISLSKNPTVGFVNSVSIPEYGFDNPMHPIISLDKKSFGKNIKWSSDTDAVCGGFKYKGMKLPLILTKRGKSKHTTKKHEEFHGIRLPFEKSKLHPGYFSNEFYEEYLAQLLTYSDDATFEKDFFIYLKDAEYYTPQDYLTIRKWIIGLALPLVISEIVLKTVAQFNPLVILFPNVSYAGLGYLVYGEYAMRKLRKFTPSIENIRTSTDKPILPFLARITHNELISISNEISDGKSLDRIIEEREKGKYGYRWEIIHDRLCI